MTAKRVSALIRRGMGIVMRNRRLQRLRLPPYPLLNVGCGPVPEPGFLNLDWDWSPSIHLCWDMRRGIPLRDCSLDGIFTEHCLEHVTHEECARVLRDFHRVLRPGGTVRVIVPDGGLYLELYRRARGGEAVEFPYLDEIGRRDLAEDSRYGFTPMMAVNRIFRGYGHQFAYDEETMGNLLRQAGFARIEGAAFREGRMPALLIDSELRAPQSFAIEASK